MNVFHYVGPPELRAQRIQTARFRVEVAADISAWVRTQPRGEALVATFVVDARGALWIADRRTEHIACSRGEAVQTAGELSFEVRGTRVEVVAASNQSTGFCPRVESWNSLERALDAAGLTHPPTWTRAFEFRRCEACGALNLVKDDWSVCATCDADLPGEWNIGNKRDTPY